MMDFTFQSSKLLSQKVKENDDLKDLIEDTPFLKTDEVASELIPIIKEKSDV